MKVSVIVPVYNAEKYLEKCLNSIINQTYKNIEIIAINDGSTDNSLEIINQYEKKDNRIKKIDQSNQGCVKTRLNGIKIATGDYCMFVDSDDWIDECTVENLITKIKLTNANIIKYRLIYEPSKIVQNEIIQGNDTEFCDERKQELYKILFTTNDLNNLCNEIIETKLFDLNNQELNVNINQGEDFLINLNLFYKAEKILLTNDIYYHYFKNDDSITNTLKIDKIKKNINDLLYVYNVINESLGKFKLNDNKELIEEIELQHINGIYGQIFKLLQSSELRKKDLLLLQKEVEENGFYDLIKNVNKKNIKDKNLLKRFMKLNILNKKIQDNYKYRCIIALYNTIRY